MRSYDFVVLGGGVSGLGFGKRMTEHGQSVFILEKEKELGGLSRTLRHKGFYLDFCAHRFHTENKALLDEILSLEGLTMQKHYKKARIYLFGQYLKYPFEIESLLRAMPFSESLLSACSFLWNLLLVKLKLKRTRELRSYKDWFVNLYGTRLYQIMCYPYTAKLWHVDPSELSADWANQRFQTENLKKLMRRMIKKLLTFNFSSHDLKDDSLAPDGGPFYYPLRGIQGVPDALARAVRAHGGEILSGVEVTRVSKREQTVTYRWQEREVPVRYGTLISTIPLQTFYWLQERRDKAVEEALAGLRYMDIIFVYLFLNTPRVSPDHWLYFPDKDIIFNRAVEFGNWSAEMCPPGKTSVCFDITAFRGDETWCVSDEALADRVISDACRIGYLKRECLDSWWVVRIPYAYPFYDLDYKKKLTTIVNFLEDEHTFLLGRTGIFRYNNSDNSIEMGFELAENILGGKAQKSVYEYQVKDISY